MEQVLAVIQVRSIKQMHQLVLGAKLDDTLFEMLVDQKQCGHLRRVLIESYFTPEVRQQLVEIGKITAVSCSFPPARAAFHLAWPLTTLASCCNHPQFA